MTDPRSGTFAISRETLTIIYVLRYTLDMDTMTRPRMRPAGEAQAGGCCEPMPAEDDAVLLAAGTSATLAERLKALADPTRLRMLDLLAAQREPLCVCEITARFDLRQPTISHHLRILREAGLIGGEKRGVWSYYWATASGTRAVSVVKDLLA